MRERDLPDHGGKGGHKKIHTEIDRRKRERSMEDRQIEIDTSR